VLARTTATALRRGGAATFSMIPMSTISTEALIGILIVGLLLSLAVICAMKGKWGFAFLGLLLYPVWLIGAIRLAKPGSLWASRWYGEDKLARAEQRFDNSKLDAERDSLVHPQDSEPWEDEDPAAQDRLTRRGRKR
jgi:hypothetical protein